jgi:hypothetical protein
MRRLNSADSLLELSYAAQSLLDDVHGCWSRRRFGIAILVGSRRHGPDWHGQLVDRLPQRLVLTKTRPSKTDPRPEAGTCTERAG